MSKHAFAGSVALLLATTAVARADVDARTIWSDWQETFAGFGGTLSAGSEDFADGTLTLRDVTSSSEIGEGASSTTYGTVTMVEQGDGTVRIEVPASFETVQTVTVEEETVEQTIRFENAGLTVVASEEAGVRSYDVSAESVSAAFEQPPVGEAPAVESTVSMTGLASTYRSGMGGDADAFEQSLTAEAFAVAFGGGEGGDGTEAAMDGTYRATGISGEVTGSFGPVSDGPIVGLADLGLVYDGAFRHAGSTLTVAGTGPQGDFAVDGTSASGEVRTAIGDGAFVNEVRSAEPEMTLTVPAFPVPIEVSMAELSSATTLPMGEPTGDEQPFALELALRDLMVDDAIWAAFDPTGQLPRDPASFVLALEGSAVMAVDMFGGPEAMAEAEGVPGKFRSLDLTELTLTVAGAALRGSGALTFPNATPVPEPVGTIELTLEGGFALMDKLVALGFVPAEQAAFVKGMAGAVTRPVGDDQLRSTIEFTEGGGISANGLPLR